MMLHTEAIRERAVMRFAVTYSGEGRVLKDAVRERKVNRYCDRFFAVMQSDAPFMDEDDAIQQLAPVAVWFIGWAARQFAIVVIRWLWAAWHDEST